MSKPGEAEWIWEYYASGALPDPLAWLAEQLDDVAVHSERTARDLLRRAAQADADEVVELLLARGTEVDGYTLHLAISLDKPALLRRLLAAGGDVDAIGIDGPLIVDAIVAGRPDFVNLLLDEGADLELAFLIGTPLMWAAFRGDRALVELLLARGADPAAFHDGDTPASVAASRGHDELAALLRQRAEPAPRSPPRGARGPR